MTATNDEVGADQRSAAPAGSSRQSGQTAPTTLTQSASSVVPSATAMVTTAEIPVTSAHSPSVRPSEGYYESSHWYHEQQRRIPAAPALRAVVWFLFFVFVLALIGLAIEHYHPTWISFLRQTGAVTKPGTGSSHLASTPSSTLGSQVKLLSATAAGTTYALPTSHYELVITTTRACWIEVRSPANSSSLRYAQTLPAAKASSFSLSGSSSITLAATASSLQVRAGSSTLTTISTPKVNHLYTFRPATS